VVDTNKQLIPNGFIYMRAEPKTCHNRLNVRSVLSFSSLTPNLNAFSPFNGKVIESFFS
jgi:hypothetical protein